MDEWGGANESIKDDRQRGLYGKYHVERADGKHKGPYFVLAYATDPHAAVALAAYADSCEADYPNLAADLREELRGQMIESPAYLENRTCKRCGRFDILCDCQCICRLNSAGGIHVYDPDCAMHFPPKT